MVEKSANRLAMSEPCAFIKPDGKRCKAYAMHDSEFCYMHTGDNAKTAGRKGGYAAARPVTLPPTEMPELPLDAEEDMVIPVLQRAVKQLEAMRASPSIMATLGSVASALDRAIERRISRGADVMKIEVEYINNWRSEAPGGAG
jgi:hypothetical protein